MSSGWFDHTKPSLSTSLQGKQGAYALVRGPSNLIESSRNIITEIARCVEFCHMGSGWFDCTEPSLSTSLQGLQGMQGVVHLFGVVQAHRTFSNHIITEIARCLEFCHMSSGWFDCLLYLHRYKGNKVCRVLMHLFGVVQAHRTSSNLLEPHHYRDSKVFRVLSHEFGVVRLYRTFSIL